MSADIPNVLLQICWCGFFSSSHLLIKHTTAPLNCSRMWKQDVEVSGLHCWFWHEVLELFALPHWGVFPSCLSPRLFSIMCLSGADKPIWVVNFFALMVDFCTHKLITIISVIKTCLFVFFSPVWLIPITWGQSLPYTYLAVSFLIPADRFAAFFLR